MNYLADNYVRSRRIADGTLFCFPPRPAGIQRPFGFVLIVFGGVVTAFMVFWMWHPISGSFSGEDNAVDWFSLLFGLLGTPGLVIGLGLCGAGLALILNLLRTEVLLTKDKLFSIERVGPFRWKRSRYSEDIERIVFTRALPSSPAPESGGTDLCGIMAEGEDMKPLIVVAGYSRGLLTPFVETIAKSVRAASPEPVSVEERWDSHEAEDGKEEIPVEKPEETVSTITERADGVTIAVPPVGLVKGSKGLFMFSMIWNVIVGVVVAVFIATGTKQADGGLWIAALVLGAFLLVGILMLGVSISMGRRQAILVAMDERLIVKRVSPFGIREHTFQQGELRAVRMDASGMTINDRPVMELQIHSGSGNKLGMLSQLPEEELSWIASVLRTAVKVRG
jgi:hypothetical protein